MNEHPYNSANAWIPLDGTVVRIVEAAAKRHPNWPDKQNLLGLVMLSTGRVKEAADVFAGCLELNPRFVWPALNRTQALAIAGDLAEARRTLDAIDHVSAAARLIALAFVELVAGRPEAAAEHLDRADAEVAGRHDVRRLRLAVRRATGDDTAARGWELLRAEMSAFDPTTAVPWDVDGSPAGRWHSFVPGLHHLWYEAGSLLARMGRISEAERAASIAHMLWAEPGLHPYQQALVAAFRGEEEKALSLLLEAVRLAPRDPRPHATLTFLWSERGDHRRALESADAALGRAPGYPDLHYQKGLLLRADGRSEEALVAFRRALEINPRYAAARLAEADELFALSRWAEARGAYAKVLEMGLASLDIHIRLAQIEERLGHPERAASAYHEATLLNPDDAELYYLIGSFHLRRGDREAAGLAWRKYLELNCDHQHAAEVERFLKSA